jgi:hypothetical protein
LINASEHLFFQFFLFAGYWLIAPLQSVGFVSEVGQVWRPDGNILSGYPLPVLQGWRGIEIPDKRFRAMTDLGTTLITALHKSGDRAIFWVVAGGLLINLQIIAGDGFF